MKIVLAGSLPPIKDGIADHNNSLFSRLIKDKKNDYLIIPSLNNTNIFKNDVFKKHIYDFESLKKTKIDLIHFQFGNSLNNSYLLQLFNYYKKNNVKIISTLHDTTNTNVAKILRTLASNPLLLKYEINKPSINEILIRSDSIIVYSNYLKNELLKIHPNNKIHVMYQGTEIYKENRFGRDKLDKNEFRISSFGFITPRKGYETVFKALDVLNREGINFKYFLIGKFNFIHYKYYLSFLVRKYKLDNRILFLGYQSYKDTKKILISSNLIIQPRLFSNEGASASLVSALSSGIPVVTVNIGGLSEYIKNNKTGILIDHSREEYVTAIRKLYKNRKLAKNLGMNAREWVIKNLDWDIIAKQHLEIFNKLRIKL